MKESIINKNAITELGKSIVALQNKAVEQTLLICKPEVEKIILTKVKDENIIEHILDALLDVAFNDEVLMLFKRLCRYYYDINSTSTIGYINAYREIWDDCEETKAKG